MKLYGPHMMKDELGLETLKHGFIKNMWVEFKDSSGSVKKDEAGTKKAETTHVIRCRKGSMPSPSKEMYIVYQGMKYEFEYWIPDYEDNNSLDIIVKVVIE